MAPKRQPDQDQADRMAPELALIVERWDELPEAVRAGIVAMVDAVGGAG